MATADTTGTIAGSSVVQGGASAVGPIPAGPSVGESLTSQSPLASALKAGLGNISQEATVTFVKYYKVVLPADGWVYWVKAQSISPSAILNRSPLNMFVANAGPRVVATAETLAAPGSLHIATINQQAAEESFSTNTVTFTSKVLIQDLNEVSPSMMYIATIGDFRFAFSERKNFYKQADLYHYVGSGVYPIMEPMIIDGLDAFDRSLVVSNSLPIFLSLNAVMPVYPSFLVPDNLPPPYASVDIESTDALQMAPYLDQTGSHWQLVRDRVAITIYGLRNRPALDYQDYLFQESVNRGDFGLMSSPVVRDLKRGQVETSTLAIKKAMALDVSYYQTVARDVAQQLILSASASFDIAA